MKNYNRLKHSNFYVILLWVVLTGININKAYHIDDTFHLEAAECIAQHPLKPMSGNINWYGSPSPMHTYNQPPLFFYFIFIFQKLFGNSEISLHLLLSVFTFLSLFYFRKISKFLKVKNQKTLLTVFAFCPAFIVNQNLMTDVPILAISLGIIFYLLKGQEQKNTKYYLISAILLSFGLLIKYTLLPVFFIILLVILMSDQYKKSIVLILPILTLTLWSVWNLYEFGSVHIFSRPISEFQFNKLQAFLGTLGAIVTFTPVFIYKRFPKRFTRFLIIIGFLLFVSFIPFVYKGFIKESLFNNILNSLFLFNGLVLVILIIDNAVDSFIKYKRNYIQTPYFTLVIYIFGLASFIAFFSPFNATRHVLLLIPFILLFGHKHFEISKGIINNLVVVVTIMLGVLLGISDYLYADFYRKNAAKVEITDNKVWSLGHWGWQWYSKNAGMSIFSTENELNVRNGDIIVYPGNISQQNLPSEIQTDTINTITQAPTVFTFFSGKNYASMYNSYADKPAWSLSNNPIDTIFVCKVIKEMGIEDVINRIKSYEPWFNDVQKKAIERKIDPDSMLILDAKWLIEQTRKDL